MPIYMIIALDIVMIIRFSINCPTIICLPTVCYMFKREASSENYGPRVYLLSYYFQIYKIKNTKIPCGNLFILFRTFTYLLYPSLSDLILASTVKGLTTPLPHWVQVFVCLCRYNYWRLLCSSYWIDTLILD